MTKSEPRKGTPEGDIFDGKVFMAVGVGAFLILAALDVMPLAALIGGILFVVGVVKYHAGHVRRP